MIRIHQVRPELELDGTHRFMAEFFEREFEGVTFTVETEETPRDESDRLKSSANYILYFVNNYGIDKMTCVDLTFDLATRPKRVLIAMSNEDEDIGQYVQDSTKQVLQQLSRLFPESGYQYFGNLVQLTAFLDSRQPKTQEPT